MWALGRHIVSIVHRSFSHNISSFPTIMEVIEKSLEDDNKIVVQSACATLSVVSEEAREVPPKYLLLEYLN